MKPLAISLIILLFIPDIASSFPEMPERRREQFSTEEGHVVIPAPYSLKGIGEGVALLASFYNIGDTNTDIFGAAFTGDLAGIGGGMTEYHILDKRLFLDLTVQNLSKAVIQSYRGRGMETKQDDYSLIEVDDMLFTGGRLTLSFQERMFEVYAQGYNGKFKIGSLRDSDGNLLSPYSRPSRLRSATAG